MVCTEEAEARRREAGFADHDFEKVDPQLRFQIAEGLQGGQSDDVEFFLIARPLGERRHPFATPDGTEGVCSGSPDIRFRIAERLDHRRVAAIATDPPNGVHEQLTHIDVLGRERLHQDVHHPTTEFD